MTEFTEFRLVTPSGKKTKGPETPLDPARGARIKAARERTDINLTQSQLAARIGIDVGTVSRWERGFPVKPRDVAALMVALRIPAEEIDAEAAKSLGELIASWQGEVSGNVVSEPGFGGLKIEGYAPTGRIEPGRFSPAAVLKTRAVLGFLYRFKAEAIEAGASEDQAETAADLVAQVVRSPSVGGAHQDWSVDEALAAMKPEAADHIRTFRKFDRR